MDVSGVIASINDSTEEVSKLVTDLCLCQQGWM